MEYVYATLLLHWARREISEESLRKVLEAAGIAVDEIRLKSFIAALKEINIDEVIKTATTIPLTPTPMTAPSTTPVQAVESAKPKEEKKEEEKKETVTEEQLAEGLAALFG